LTLNLYSWIREALLATHTMLFCGTTLWIVEKVVPLLNYNINWENFSRQKSNITNTKYRISQHSIMTWHTLRILANNPRDRIDPQTPLICLGTFDGMIGKSGEHRMEYNLPLNNQICEYYIKKTTTAIVPG
jgi:hypothetical protein